jgi:hypothetical protein
VYTPLDNGNFTHPSGNRTPSLSSLLFFVPSLQVLFRPGGLPFRSSHVLGILFAQIFLHHRARLHLKIAFKSLPTSSDGTRMSRRHSNLYTILSVSVSKLASFSFRCWNSAALSGSEMLFYIPRSVCVGFPGSARICGGEAPPRSGLFTLSRPTSRGI